VAPFFPDAGTRSPVHRLSTDYRFHPGVISALFPHLPPSPCSVAQPRLTTFGWRLTRCFSLPARETRENLSLSLSVPRFLDNCCRYHVFVCVTSSKGENTVILYLLCVRMRILASEERTFTPSSIRRRTNGTRKTVAYAHARMYQALCESLIHVWARAGVTAGVARLHKVMRVTVRGGR